MLQGPATKVRWILMAAILLSLIAPWYDLSDGPVSGWFVLVSGFLAPPSSWAIERLIIILIAVNLIAAVALGLNITSFAHQRKYRWLLLSTLAFLVVWILTPNPNRLFGVWLTAACLVAAVLLELINWVAAGGR